MNKPDNSLENRPDKTDKSKFLNITSLRQGVSSKGFNLSTLFRFLVGRIKRTVFVIIAAAKNFNNDKCTLQASALTFYSLLSIVPVMAMAFGVAKGFGFEKILQKELLAKLGGQEEVARRLIEFSGKLLSETKGGIMAVIGLIFLLWTVVKMFGRIEEAFNSIWWVKEGRPMIRKFTDYIALLLTAPLLVIFSGSTTVFITTRLNRMIAASGAVYFLQSITTFLLKLLPYGTIWLLFTFLYVFIPNKKINLKSAFAGGIIAGTIYQTAQMLYINFQVGVSHYNAIYGSFAALPLFLIWLQVSWTLLLLGAEIAFVWENADDLIRNKTLSDPDAVCIKMKKLLCLRIVLLCVKRFAEGVRPASDAEIASELGLGMGMVRMLLSMLVDCEILSEVNYKKGRGFQPAKNIENLTIMSVINAFEDNGRGDENIQISGTMEFEALNEAIEGFRRAAEKLPGNRLLKNI